MTKTFLAISLLCLGVALSGCSTTGAKVLDNLQGCERHYDGAISGGLTGGQFSGTIEIHCIPAGVVQPVAVDEVL